MYLILKTKQQSFIITLRFKNLFKNEEPKHQARLPEHGQTTV